MAFSGFKNFGSFAKIGNALSSSVSETLGLTSSLGMPIAVEFGTGSLKVLQVSQGDPPALVAAACLETPDDLLANHKKRLEFQLEGLPRLIRRGGFKGRRAVCAIPAWKTVCKHLSLQRVDGMSLADQVRDSLSVSFGRDPDTLLHRYTEIAAPDKAHRAEVIITAIGRELVDRLMKGIAGCKLQPVGMHSEFAAVLKTFDHVHRRDADLLVNTLYLDIGASTTNVMISHGTELAFARVIDIGGRHLDELLAKQLSCDHAEARTQRLAAQGLVLAAPAVPKPVEVPVPVAAAAPGGEGVAAPSADWTDRTKTTMAPGFTQDVHTQPQAPVSPQSGDLSEPLESLTDEIMMCLRYHEGQFPGKRVERAIFVGGEARGRGLCQAIAKSLRLPAQMADPLARVMRMGTEPTQGVDLKVAQPGWAVALGLCLLPTDL